MKVKQSRPNAENGRIDLSFLGIFSQIRASTSVLMDDLSVSHATRHTPTPLHVHINNLPLNGLGGR